MQASRQKSSSANFSAISEVINRATLLLNIRFDLVERDDEADFLSLGFLILQGFDSRFDRCLNARDSSDPVILSPSVLARVN